MSLGREKPLFAFFNLTNSGLVIGVVQLVQYNNDKVPPWFPFIFPTEVVVIAKTLSSQN